MTFYDITAVASAGESETLEFKAMTGTRRKAAMTVCAFLGQQGVRELFGVDSSEAVAGGGGCAD